MNSKFKDKQVYSLLKLKLKYILLIFLVEVL